MKVLITDGNERAALAVTRALGRQQVEVMVGAESTRSLAASSRYCQQRIIYPSPYQEPERFVTSLLKVVQESRIDALFPVSDIAMHVLGPEKSRFEPYTHVPIPTAEAFQEISDKYRLMRQAVEEGVPIPDTLFVPDGRLEELSALTGIISKPDATVVEQAVAASSDLPDISACANIEALQAPTPLPENPPPPAGFPCRFPPASQYSARNTDAETPAATHNAPSHADFLHC